MLKKILPKTIFFRYLIIIIAPVLILQIILTVVFFDSLWIKTNKGLVRSLAGEINTLVEVYSDPKASKDFDLVKNLFENKLISKINVLKNYKLPKLKKPSLLSLYDQLIDEELERELRYPFWYDTKSRTDVVDIRVSTNKTILQFIVEKSRIRNSSARIFILWITIPSLILLFISILFLRNQIRPFTILAESAEKFGKGQYVPEIKPSGAIEVRKAIIEFEKMKRRILRHISQRTAMLSGISHDLKTPLTRLKLQIEILNKNNILDKVKNDILEMEKMISEYLDFSSSQDIGNTVQFDLSNLMTEIMHKYSNKKISLKCNEKILMLGRKHLIKRCIYNLIDNSLKYAGNAQINVKKNSQNIEIMIDDNGPGIPEFEREKVLRPFYRLDKSRKITDGSVGLGLSIVQDIVNSHGGKIKLNDNPKGQGLRVLFNVSSLMFVHDFNSIIINIGPIAIRWYSLAYIFGIFFGLYYGKYLIRSLNNKFNISEKNLDDYIIWSVISIIIGGRLGYVFFYNFKYYIQNPVEIIMVWNGGMSFHGGLLGIVISSLFFSKKNNVSFWSLTDLLACISPIGIFLGRIANFINAELVGKTSDVPWSFIFPKYDNKPRHPSQLYEAFLEGILLFVLLNFLIRKIDYEKGKISILFLIFYSFFRMIGEFFREPDQHLGYLMFGLSMGSILSLLAIIIGFIALIILKKNDYK